MNFQYFKEKIALVNPIYTGQSVQITVDQTLTGSTTLNAMFEQTLGVTSFVLDALMLDNQSDYIRITGFVDLLYVEKMEFDLLVRDGGDESSFVMQLRIPVGWTFYGSFPEMPLLDASKRAFAQFLTLMDVFRYSTSWLIFSNVAGYHDGLETELVQGLNFKGEVFPPAAISTLTDAMGIPSSLQMSGPVLEYLAKPDPMHFTGIRLACPIPVAFDFGGIKVLSSRLMLKSPIRDGDTELQTSAIADPGIYIYVEMEVDGRPLEIVADFDPIFGGELTFRGYFTDFAVGSLSTLDTSVGGAGMADQAPKEIGPPTGLSITEFGFQLDLLARNLTYIYVGIGCGNTWELVPDWIFLSQLGLRFTIFNPFTSTLRSFGVGVSGVLEIKGVGLEFFVDYPSLDFTVRKSPQDVLSLGHLLEAMAPGVGDVPEIYIDILNIKGNASQKNLSITGRASALAEIPIGNTVLSFDMLAFYVHYVKGGKSSGMLSMEMSLGEARGSLSAILSSQSVFSGSLINMSLHQTFMAITGETTVPDEIPEVLFQQLNVTYNYSTGAFDINGSANIAYYGLPSDEPIATAIEFKIAKTVPGQSVANSSTTVSGSSQTTVAPETTTPGTATTTVATTGGYSISLSLTSSSIVPIAEGFKLTALALRFSYQSQVGWSLGGTIGAVLFDQPISLAASYTSTAAGMALTLVATAAPALSLLSAPHLYSLDWSRFDLGISTSNVEGGGSTKAFNVRIDAVLNIEGAGSFGGAIEFLKSMDGKVTFKFRNLSLDMYHIPIADGVGIDFRPKEIGITADPYGNGWAFYGQVFLAITGVPGKLGKMLPTETFASITLNANECKLEVMNPFTPFKFPLPDADGKSLGSFVLDVRSIGIALRPVIGLTCEVGLGFPKELNEYFGSKVFREYEAGNPMSMAMIRTSVGLGGISLQFITSPFLSGTTSTSPSDEAWINIDFDDCGEIRMKIPSFRYDVTTSYFEASGGFEVVRPLSIPLTPLQNLLKAVGMDAAAQVFPDKVPVSSLSLVDANDNLKTDEFVDFLKKAGDVPSEITSALRTTGNLLNHFPDEFKRYFKIAIPERLDFKFGFSPMGRVALSLLAPIDPIRILYPTVIPGFVPMPGLMGLQLREITIGTLLSGSLFYGQIDATIDMFDIASLAISLMLPTDEDFPLPTSDQLMRRVILDKVFCIIPLSQGVPVPVPIFYDEIGFEYMGVEGIGLQAHVGFPKPDLGGASTLFNTLKTFFKDPKYLLDPKTAPGGVDLQFHFRNEFLQAPEYMGSGVLGSKGKENIVGLWQYIARMMNFCKTFKVTDAIGAIPYEYRVGSAEYKLAFLDFNADWLLTTPAEFRDGAFGQLKLSKSDVQDFMDVLPALATNDGKQIGDNEDGIVAFLRGEADLGFLRLEAVFGLAASGSLGFNTGFKFDGTIASIIEFELKGALLVNAPVVANSTSYAHPTTEQIHASSIEATVSQGKALLFDGKKTSVQVPASSSLLLSAYTIEVWAKIDKPTDQWKGVVGKPGRNFCIYIHRDGFVHHRFHTSKGTNMGAPNSPNGSLKFGVWQHIAITNDGYTARTYINGMLQAEGAVDGEMIIDNTNLIIGRELDDKQSAWLSASLQEVRIWKAPRTAAEIQATMYEQIPTDSQNLVSLYRFDSDTGNKAVDLCGLNHGFITNGTWTDSDLLLLKGLDFDGKTDYIEVTDSESLRIGAYTVEAWVRPVVNFPNTWGCIVGKKGRNYSMFVNVNGYVHHRFHTSKNGNDGAPNTPNGSVTWGTWNHIAITNDGKTATTYINGEVKAQGPVADGGLIIDKTNLQIGRRPEADIAEFFAGEIAEIRIWNAVRNQDQLRTAMHTRLGGKEANLVSLYRLGDMTGDTLVDLANRNAGKANVTALKQPELLRHDGLVFNGANDCAVLPAHDSLKPSQYTIEAWILPANDQQKDWSCIVGGKPGAFPSLWISKTGQISHRYPVDGKNTQLNSDDNNVVWGEWNHLAITFDTFSAVIYLNGKAVKTTKFTKKAGFVNMPAPVTLSVQSSAIQVGRQPAGNKDNFFKGSIDDIRIWSVARSAEQIAYTKDHPLTGMETGLLLWCDMDHTNGKSIIDKGPLKLNGTVTGAQWALAKSPVDLQNAALQLYGHAHIDVLGHRALQADLRLINGDFWFSGVMSLFPDSWPLAIKGQVEGQFSKDRFYLAGDTENSIFGLVLSSSRFYLSNDTMRLEGRWLGAYALLDISWENKEPKFAGTVSFDFHPSINFGAIYIGGVKVADNFKLSLDIHAGLDIRISKAGFSADIAASFAINGKGFSLNFSIDIVPSDIDHLIDWIRKRIIDKAMDYLADLFSSAAEWLKNVASKAIEWAEDAGEAVGRALGKAFKATAEECAALLKNAGYAAEKVGRALISGYNAAADAAASVLKKAGYVANEVGDALKNSYGKAADEAAKVLKGIGYAANEVGGALKNSFGKAADESAKVLKGIGYGANEVGSALKDTFGKAASDAAKIMKDVGYASAEVGKALKDTFGQSYQDCAKAMKAAGYAAEDVGNTLKGAYNKSAEEVGKAMKDVGYAAEDVSKVFKNVYSMSASESAKLLKDGLNFSKDACDTALKGAGYAAKEVGDAVGGAFKSAGKAVKKFFGL